jgi:tRNA(Ile)-lysidine synthase
MRERLERFIDEHGLFSKSEHVIVGYSGGADSTCLLHLLARCGYTVSAAHLNHKMRPEAKEEAERCRAFAEELGIGFVPGEADVPAIAKEGRIGIEEAGREARYHFFSQAIATLHGDKVATAHTLNDHAESILLHLARGCGLAGLAGIPAMRGYIVRPMLWATRRECRGYCEENHLWFHDDPANEDIGNARVRVRNSAIPSLESVNERALDNLARFADIAREEDALLNAIAVRALEAAEEKSEHPLAFLAKMSEVRLDVETLMHHPPAVLRRGIHLAAKALGASATYEQCQAVFHAIKGGEKCSVTFEGGDVVAETDATRLVLRALESVEGYRQPLTLPGETASDELGWTVQGVFGAEFPLNAGSLRAELDADSLKGGLFVRPFQPGDRMQPVGRNESKLQDLLTNRKVTAPMKARLPMVCDMVGIVWAPGVAVAERAAAGPTTKRRLSLQFGPVLTD